MTKRIEPVDGEWIDLSNNFSESVSEYAMENNLRFGEAVVSYLETELLGEGQADTDSDDESDDESNDE